MEKKRICLLTSGHPPFDERIFWKFGITLAQNNYDVIIISSIENLNMEKEKVCFNCFDGQLLSKKDKIHTFFERLKTHNPERIICFEPLPILAANRYCKEINNNAKLLLDVTEYYPHQNTLSEFKGIIRFLKFVQLFLFNVYVSNLVDSIIVGEINKAKLYKWITPFKTKNIIGYYAPKKYFRFNKPTSDQQLTFCFLGEQSKERGFFNFLKVISKVSKNSKYKVKVNLIGYSFKDKDIQTRLLTNLIDSDNVMIKQFERIEFNRLSELMNESNFFIDLREKNIIFNRSLPIRIFDYMACGRPIIFSNLGPLSELTDIQSFTHLIEPEDIDKTVRIINDYLENKKPYLSHCIEARKLFEEKYNWEAVEPKLLEIIN